MELEEAGFDHVLEERSDASEAECEQRNANDDYIEEMKAQIKEETARQKKEQLAKDREG